MRTSIVFLLFLAITCSGLAQTADVPEKQDKQGSSAPQTELPPAPPVTPQSREYLLGPGDVVKIAVFDMPELGKTVRVSNSGKIHLPYLGVFPIAGMTSLALERDIASRLQRQKLVKDPQVQVMIAEYRAQPVYILGEVGRPGQYVLNEKTYLMDLITMAGGVNTVARKYGFLYRRTPNPPEANEWNSDSSSPAAAKKDASALYQVTKIDLTRLIEGQKLDLNIELQGGDLFHVPQLETDLFYVVGQVMRTGGFQVPTGEKLLVSRALSMAGGPGKTAKMSQGVVIRYDETGQRREIPADFAAIFKGKQPDFPVEANDIIFIPGSQIKTIGYGLLGILPSLAGHAVYSGSSAYMPHQ